MDILTQKTITSFKEELFCTGDVFDIERWDVKIPRHNDDEWVPISLKEKFYAMFDHFEDHNSVLVFKKFNSDILRIKASLVEHNYYRIFPVERTEFKEETE